MSEGTRPYWAVSRSSYRLQPARSPGRVLGGHVRTDHGPGGGDVLTQADIEAASRILDHASLFQRVESVPLRQLRTGVHQELL